MAVKIDVCLGFAGKMGDGIHSPEMLCDLWLHACQRGSSVHQDGERLGVSGEVSTIRYKKQLENPPTCRSSF